MDFLHEQIEEDSKYAFLLGSALRNDGPEQVLNIYDNLIPHHISDERLEKIKEEARHFAELPEPDFNALVLQARTFSLASGRRAFPTPYSSSGGSNIMSGSQQQQLNNSNGAGGWSLSALPTLADDTALEQDAEEVIAGDDRALFASPSSKRRGEGGLSSAAVFGCEKRPVRNHFAPPQQDHTHHHHQSFTASSPKHGAYHPARYSDSSCSPAGFGLQTNKQYGFSPGTDGKLVHHDDVTLDLDLALTSSADEDSGLPRSTSSHKASSDGPYSDESQDGDEHGDLSGSSSRNHAGIDDGDEAEGEEEEEGERQSLLRGRKQSRKAEASRGERERSLVCVRPTQPDPPYDEEVPLNTSTGSSEYVESPRSEDRDAEERDDAFSATSSSGLYGSCSRGLEMGVIAYRETPHPTGRRSPSPLDSVNAHKHLYSPYSRRREDEEVWHYSENSRRCDEDDNKEDEDDDFYHSSYRKLQSRAAESSYYDSHARAGRGAGTITTASGGTSTSASFAPTQVDTKIPFLGSASASSAMAYGSAQYSYNMQHELGASSAAAAASRKAKARKGRSKASPSPPVQAATLSVRGPLVMRSVDQQALQLQRMGFLSILNGHADDSDKLEQQPATALVDVNGNPTQLDLSNYPRMRQSPYSPSSPAQHTSSTSTSSSSGGQPTAGSLESSEYMRRRQRQLRSSKHNNKQKIVLADQYDDHQKFAVNTPIEAILDFIEGTGSGKGKKQTGGKEPVTQETGKATTRKKQGAKKETSLILNGQLSTEERAAEEDAVNQKASVTAMGNSVSAKCDEEEISAPSLTENLEKVTDYQDCVDPVHVEEIKPDKERGHSEINDGGNKKDLLHLKENDQLKALAKEEELGRTSDSAEGSGKISNNKKAKTKQAPGKKESPAVGVLVNGPVSPKPNMVKSQPDSEEKVEGNDSGVRNQLSPDLDASLRREEVFVEVKKKKKRTGAKESTMLLPSTSTPFVGNQYYSRNANGVAGQIGFRNAGFHRPPRSSTPPTPAQTGSAGTTTTSVASSTISMTYTTTATTTPIVSSSNTALSISSNSSNSSSSGVEHQLHPPRDLSPSAFPVLEGHSLPPTGNEGRRNSCGDATDLLVESKSLCDSDRESVKSLPATSPMYPISYARMAAASGPKRNNSSYPESIASPSSESGLGWPNSSSSSVAYTPGSSCYTSSPGGVPTPTPPTPHTPERKASTAVWKGSPRERRHSIGSSPAEEKLCPSGGEECGDAGMASRSRQKSGSQEFLNRDLVCPPAAAPADVGASVIKAIHTSESSCSLQSDSNLSEDAVSPVAVSHQPPPKRPAVKAAVSSSTHAAATTSVTTTASKPPAEGLTSVPSQPTPSQKKTTREAAETSIKKDSAAATAPSQPAKGRPSSSSSRTNSTSTTSSGVNNTKSVVFLDKRCASSQAQSLGITFGFDSTFDSVAESAPKEEKNLPAIVPENSSNQPPSLQTPATLPPAVSLSSPFSLPPSQGQPTGSQQPTKHHNIPSSSSSSPSVSPSGSSQRAVNTSASSDKKVPKGPHIERLPNGVVLPPPSQPVTGSNVPSLQTRLSGSKPVVVGAAGVAPAGLVIPFSPNYPPPPLPQSHAVVASSSGPPMAIPHKVGEAAKPTSVPPPQPESQDFRKLACLPDISQPPPVPSINPALPPQHRQHTNPPRQQQQQPKPTAFPVVYGLKIKPDGGCGKLFFIPPPPANLVKSTRPKDCPEVSNFLKKQWTGVKVPTGQNSTTYSALKED